MLANMLIHSINRVLNVFGLSILPVAFDFCYLQNLFIDLANQRSFIM